MDAHDVKSLHDSMRKYGIPGVLEPVDPRNPSGAWRVVDTDTQRDVTDAVPARRTTFVCDEVIMRRAGVGATNRDERGPDPGHASHEPSPARNRPGRA